MKVGAIPVENLIKKYSCEGFILEIGADTNRNITTKYPELVNFIFNKFDHNNVVTIEIDKNKSPHVIGDARMLPFKDSTFDVILLISVLEHCYERFEEIIKESERVASHSGIVIGFVPFFLSYHGNDYWRFTYEGVEKLLKEFKNVKIIPVGGPFSVCFQIIIDMIKPNLLREFVSYMFSFVSMPLDRFIWNIYKKYNLKECFTTRGYLFIGEK